MEGAARAKAEPVDPWVEWGLRWIDSERENGGPSEEALPCTPMQLGLGKYIWKLEWFHIQILRFCHLLAFQS